MTDHDTIVIRAPVGTKTRWVRQSQAQHRKLSDWIVEAVDHLAFIDAHNIRCERRENGYWEAHSADRWASRKTFAECIDALMRDEGAKT